MHCKQDLTRQVTLVGDFAIHTLLAAFACPDNPNPSPTMQMVFHSEEQELILLGLLCACMVLRI